MFPFFRRAVLFLVGFTLPIQAFSLLPASGRLFFGLTPFKLVTALLFVLAATQLAVTGRGLAPDRKLWWLATFAVSYVISVVMAFLSGIPAIALAIVGSTTVFLILYYFLISYVVTTRRDLLLLFWALILGGAVTALPASLGLQAGHPGLESGTRFEGLSGQENLFGFDMAVCLPIGIALFMASRRLGARVLLAFAGFLMAMGLLLSLSRSAFLASGFMWAWWIYRSGRIDTIRYVVPAFAILAAVLLLAPQAARDRVDTMLDPARRAQDQSIQSRFVQFEWSLKAFATHPVAGIGVLRFIPWAREQPGGRDVTHSIHNAYLAVAAEQGLLGLVPYAMILVLSFADYGRAWRTARARRRAGDRTLTELGHYALFLQIALLGTMVNGLFGMAHHSKSAWLLLALSGVLVKLVIGRVQELENATSEQDVAAAEPEVMVLPALASGVLGRNP